MKWRFGTVSQIRDFSDTTSSFNYVLKKKPQVYKSWNKWYWVFLPLVLITTFILLCTIFLENFTVFPLISAFAVQKITVYGVNGTNADLIRQSLSSFVGKNLLTLSGAQIEKNISRFEFVEGFLFRKTYPSEITVEIKLKPSIGSVKQGNKFFEIDGIQSVWESNTIPNSYIEADSSVNLADNDFQNLVKEILSKGYESDLSLIQKKSNDCYILTTKDKEKILVSTKDFLGQWQKYQKNKNFVKKNFERYEMVDLRWSNRIVIAAYVNNYSTNQEE